MNTIIFSDWEDGVVKSIKRVVGNQSHIVIFKTTSRTKYDFLFRIDGNCEFLSFRKFFYNIGLDEQFFNENFLSINDAKFFIDNAINKYNSLKVFL